MKRSLLILCALGISLYSDAQTNTFPSSGNVGIGTTSPAASLHLGQSNQEIRLDYNGTNNYYGSLRWAGLQLGNNGINRIIAGRTAAGGRLDFYVNNTNEAADYSTSPDGILAMTLNSNGNVGIGTISPGHKLTVFGNIASNAPATNTVYDGNWSTANYIGSDGYWALRTATNYSYNLDVYNGNSPFSAMTVLQGGNVGIGTTTPSEKLSVNGKIRAKEVKVETANWPDYVFEPHYKLPDLKETEAFIKENKHLPEIPSAKEVAEGISLGEMNAKLLKKIEELTLHLISQHKQLQAQYGMLITQQQLLEKQQVQLQKLENR